MLVTLSGIVMLARLVQELNALLRMLIMPGLSVILARRVQLSNALVSMLIKPPGSVRLARPVHQRNAAFRMHVTLSGKVIPTRLPHPSKALGPTSVTGRPSMVSGMTTFPPGPLYREMETLPCMVA